MKKLLLIWVLASLVSCENKNSQPANFKTIMIKSEGEIETTPDMASFTIELSCTEKTTKASRDCLIAKSNELRDKLLSFDINKNDLLTTAINLRKEYNWKYNSRVFEGYRASTSTTVSIKDLEKLEDVYSTLLENENLSLSGLGFSHSQMDMLENEAYANALNKSNSLAERLLEELPENKKEILKIGNVELSASTPPVQQSAMIVYADMEMVQASENQSVAISKGNIKVKASIFIEYKIE